jgi:hypothetical protein
MDTNEPHYDAIVMGSGIGGMAAAGLLAGVAAGKRVLVLERHTEPGGQTHVFRRDGASWDAGLHYIGEMEPGGRAGPFLATPVRGRAALVPDDGSGSSVLSIRASTWRCRRIPPRTSARWSPHFPPRRGLCGASLGRQSSKSGNGMNRLWHALRYSLSGLRAAWDEKAFRQEALASFVLLPLAFWIGQSWVETALPCRHRSSW